MMDPSGAKKWIDNLVPMRKTSKSSDVTPVFADMALVTPKVESLNAIVGTAGDCSPQLAGGIGKADNITETNIHPLWRLSKSSEISRPKSILASNSQFYSDTWFMKEHNSLLMRAAEMQRGNFVTGDEWKGSPDTRKEGKLSFSNTATVSTASGSKRSSQRVSFDLSDDLLVSENIMQEPSVLKNAKKELGKRPSSAEKRNSGSPRPSRIGSKGSVRPRLPRTRNSKADKKEIEEELVTATTPAGDVAAENSTPRKPRHIGRKSVAKTGSNRNSRKSSKEVLKKKEEVERKRQELRDFIDEETFQGLAESNAAAPGFLRLKSDVKTAQSPDGESDVSHKISADGSVASLLDTEALAATISFDKGLNYFGKTRESERQSRFDEARNEARNALSAIVGIDQGEKETFPAASPGSGLSSTPAPPVDVEQRPEKEISEKTEIPEQKTEIPKQKTEVPEQKIGTPHQKIGEKKVTKASEQQTDAEKQSEAAGEKHAHHKQTVDESGKNTVVEKQTETSQPDPGTQTAQLGTDYIIDPETGRLREAMFDKKTLEDGKDDRESIFPKESREALNGKESTASQIRKGGGLTNLLLKGVTDVLEHVDAASIDEAVRKWREKRRSLVEEDGSESDNESAQRVDNPPRPSDLGEKEPFRDSGTLFMQSHPNKGDAESELTGDVEISSNEEDEPDEEVSLSSVETSSDEEFFSVRPSSVSLTDWTRRKRLLEDSRRSSKSEQSRSSRSEAKHPGIRIISSGKEETVEKGRFSISRGSDVIPANEDAIEDLDVEISRTMMNAFPTYETMRKRRKKFKFDDYDEENHHALAKRKEVEMTEQALQTTITEENGQLIISPGKDLFEEKIRKKIEDPFDENGNFKKAGQNDEMFEGHDQEGRHYTGGYDINGFEFRYYTGDEAPSDVPKSKYFANIKYRDHVPVILSTKKGPNFEKNKRKELWRVVDLPGDDAEQPRALIERSRSLTLSISPSKGNRQVQTVTESPNKRTTRTSIGSRSVNRSALPRSRSVLERTSDLSPELMQKVDRLREKIIRAQKREAKRARHREVRQEKRKQSRKEKKELREKRRSEKREKKRLENDRKAENESDEENLEVQRSNPIVNGTRRSSLSAKYFPVEELLTTHDGLGSQVKKRKSFCEYKEESLIEGMQISQAINKRRKRSILIKSLAESLAKDSAEVLADDSQGTQKDSERRRNSSFYGDIGVQHPQDTAVPEKHSTIASKDEGGGPSIGDNAILEGTIEEGETVSIPQKKHRHPEGSVHEAPLDNPWLRSFDMDTLPDIKPGIASAKRRGSVPENAKRGSIPENASRLDVGASGKVSDIRRRRTTSKRRGTKTTLNSTGSETNLNKRSSSPGESGGIRRLRSPILSWSPSGGMMNESTNIGYGGPPIDRDFYAPSNYAFPDITSSSPSKYPAYANTSLRGEEPNDDGPHEYRLGEEPYGYRLGQEPSPHKKGRRSSDSDAIVGHDSFNHNRPPERFAQEEPPPQPNAKERLKSVKRKMDELRSRVREMAYNRIPRPGLPAGYEKECDDLEKLLQQKRGYSKEVRHQVFRQATLRWHPDKPSGVKEVFHYLKKRQDWFLGADL